MSEKKVVGRGVAIALSVACIVLAVFAGIIAYMYLQNLDETNTQLAEARAANLINVGLGAYDMSNEPPWESKIKIDGYVCNTGHEPAYKPKLHVISYLSSGAAVIDGYFTIGSGLISGGEVVEIDMEIPYEGYGVTRTTVTPEWSDTP